MCDFDQNSMFCLISQRNVTPFYKQASISDENINSEVQYIQDRFTIKAKGGNSFIYPTSVYYEKPYPMGRKPNLNIYLYSIFHFGEYYILGWMVRF